MKLKENERGFTLIELLVAIAILSAIVGVTSMTIITTMRVSSDSNDWVVALRQVQNAGYWISRDAQMAQTVTTDEPGIFLTLSWADWGGNDYEVKYVFDGNTLERQLNGSVGILIADYIDLESTVCNWNDEENKLTNVQENKTKALRQWRFESYDEIVSAGKTIKAYIAEAIENEKQGKAIKPDRDKPLIIPSELEVELSANPQLRERFETLTKS